MRTGYSLQTQDLTKTFGKFKAVDHINLQLSPGESYGFLGPNGAGKTTTLLMILGIWQPTSGEVFINDQRISRSAFDLKRKIGVVGENQSFYEEMSAWEYLMFFGSLYEVKDVEARAMALLDKVGLAKWRNVLIGGYSTGMKKKLGFVRALLNSPELLILDEPVSGLDPFGIVQVRQLLQDEQQTGCTLLISSHILSEVERTVDRVGIIAEGRLLVEDTMNNLRSLAGATQSIRLSFAELEDNQVMAFQDLTCVQKVERDGNHLTLKVGNENDHREEIGRAILANHLVVTEMKQEEVSLEEAFITITENNLGQLTENLVEVGP